MLLQLPTFYNLFNCHYQALTFSFLLSPFPFPLSPFSPDAAVGPALTNEVSSEIVQNQILFRRLTKFVLHELSLPTLRSACSDKRSFVRDFASLNFLLSPFPFLLSPFPLILIKSLIHHCICHFQESGYIRSFYIVYKSIGIGTVFNTTLMDLGHDMMQAIINFCAAPINFH